MVTPCIDSRVPSRRVPVHLPLRARVRDIQDTSHQDQPQVGQLVEQLLPVAAYLLPSAQAPVRMYRCHVHGVQVKRLIKAP
jgi:hypothetical protein